MYFDDVFLKFQGFHPSDGTKTYVASIVRELHDESPLGSIVRASVIRNSKHFKGMVRITSSAGTFFAVANGEHIKEVTRQLMDQIRRQLSKWKGMRFRRHGLKALTEQKTHEIDATEGEFSELETVSAT